MMKTYVIATVIIASCIAFMSCSQDTSGRESKGVEIHLSTKSDDSTAGSPVILEVLVTNNAPKAIYITRLKSWPLRAFGGWAGWSLRIDGPDGQWSFVHAPSSPPPITERDIVELKPRGSFAETIDVSAAILKAERPLQRLQDTPGLYAFRINYLLKEEDLSYGRAIRSALSNAAIADLEQSLFKGPIASNELKIEVKDNDTEPNRAIDGD